MPLHWIAALLLTIIAAVPVVNGVISLAKNTIPLAAGYWAYWTLRRRFGAELYTRDDFRSALTLYIGKHHVNATGEDSGLR